MMPRVKGHPLARMIIYSVIAAVLGTVAVLLLDWFPSQGSTAAEPIDTLYDVLLIASVPIFVLVMAVAIYSVVKFRARPGDLGDGAPIHGNTRLEIVWVTIPFILVTALAVYGWIVLDDIEAKEPNTLVVDVRAQQFAWRFTYPDEGGLKTNQLVLPKDRPVEFRVTTNDVIHSFWVPQFRLKTDTVPGLTTKLRVTPSRLGRYDVVCAELCGLGHATMRQAVRVVPQDEYASWAARAKKQEKTVGGETPQETENPEKAPKH
jgi:cytochrome c oxidase subunit 2